MNIIGPDALVFGVDDLAACRQYLTDYGLADAGGDRFEALDGTAVVIRHKDDAALPGAMGTASLLRETVYGVADETTLDAIEAELRRDREVTPNALICACISGGEHSILNGGLGERVVASLASQRR